MDKILTAFVILFSIFSSGLASLIVFNFLERRDQKIRERIEELETEEEYLMRIHGDTGKLDRSTYTAILMALCVGFLSMALLAAAFALGVSSKNMQYVYLLSAWLFMLATGICFYHFRSLTRLSDFEKTRESFRQKKIELENRLR